MDRPRALIGRFIGSLLVLTVAVVALVVIASPAIAGSPPRERQKVHEGGHPGCHGIANAYSHVSANAAHDPEAARSVHDLQAVADRKGCDLSGVKPVDRPKGDGDERPDRDGGGPPADLVADKCERIGAKLDATEARPHGNSADAFARQAEKWSCPAR
jgi:hypothetical protein